MGCPNLERKDGCIDIDQRPCSFLKIEKTGKIDFFKGGLEKAILICTIEKEEGEGEKLLTNVGPATERFLLEKGMTPTSVETIGKKK